ncbi:phage integrase N-terminal SAM-like domain-containing protein [Candidatus Woesebacteria bacterium]|nr:phage integrase N-terminal SAM-like domain-containing protein [Candidatus Woesebacteria bacterium]
MYHIQTISPNLMANLIHIINKELTLRNYSKKTINAYTYVAKNLYTYYKKPLRKITTQEIREYLFDKQK